MNAQPLKAQPDYGLICIGRGCGFAWLRIGNRSPLGMVGNIVDLSF